MQRNKKRIKDNEDAKYKADDSVKEIIQQILNCSILEHQDPQVLVLVTFLKTRS